MTPPATRRFSTIEALRGLAATAVVACHAARHVDKSLTDAGLARLFEPGVAGVDLFFVISGFIILQTHRPDIGCPAGLARYAGRRFTRVWPLYWVALAATMLMDLAGSHGVPAAGSLLVSVLLLPARQAPILGIAWTLQFEVLFYAVFALLIASRRAGQTALAAWLCCIVLSRMGAPGTSMLPPQVTSTYGMEFFMGMASAELLHRGKLSVPANIAILGMAAFVLALALAGCGLLDPFATASRLVFGVAAAVLVAGLAALEASEAPAARRGLPGWLSAVGRASYSIYLFQFVCIGLVWQLVLKAPVAQDAPRVVLFLVLSVAAVCGGLVVSALIERPLLRVMRSKASSSFLTKRTKKLLFPRARAG